MHPLFDSKSKYNRFRAGFDAREKVQGYFRWLAARQTQAIRLADEERAEQASETPQLMAAAPVAESGLREAFVFVADAPDLASRASLEVQLDSAEAEGAGTFRLTLELKPPHGLADRLPAPFRVFLLDPLVAERLCRLVGAQAHSEQTLRAVFHSENVETFETAQVLSAVPELEGNLRPSGYGVTDLVPLPVLASLPEGVVVVVVLGARQEGSP